MVVDNTALDAVLNPSVDENGGIAPVPASELKVAGITPFTSIDFPGRLSAVIFVQGCPCRCSYCQNAWMQPRSFDVRLAHNTWADVQTLLEKRKGLLDAVVFSGGEPTVDPALQSAIEWVKAEGYAVGLHTSGVYPRRLAKLLPLLDWVGLDVKAPPQDAIHYESVTNLKKSATLFKQSFDLLRASSVEVEYRTTAHPAYLDEDSLEDIASFLEEQGVDSWVVQIYRRPSGGVVNLFPSVLETWPSHAFIARQQERFKQFHIRRT